MTEVLRDRHGNRQHRIVCPTCKTEAVVLAKATYCSVSCSKIGKKNPAISGSNHYRWTGDAASYSARHQRVAYQRGNPSHCEHCGATDQNRTYDWAFNNQGDPGDVSQYIRLCRTCHADFDSSLKPRGVRIAQSKLTDDLVRIFRSRAASGETCASLAREFGISKHAMWAAVTGRTWRHVA